MIRDVRMIQRAMEQRWPIKPEYRQALVARLVKIIADPKSSPREVTAASKALIAAEAQNAADEQHDDRMDDSRNRILDALARINAGANPGIVDARGTVVVDAGNPTETT